MACSGGLTPELRGRIDDSCGLSWVSVLSAIPLLGQPIADAVRPASPLEDLEAPMARAKQELAEKQLALNTKLAEMVGEDKAALQQLIEELSSRDGYVSLAIAVAAQPLRFSQIRLAIFLLSMAIVLSAVVFLYD